MIYDLPWEGITDEEADLLRDQIFALSSNEDLLLAREEEYEYEYNFNIDHYIVLAQILLKID